MSTRYDRNQKDKPVSTPSTEDKIIDAAADKVAKDMKAALKDKAANFKANAGSNAKAGLGILGRTVRAAYHTPLRTLDKAPEVLVAAARTVAKTAADAYKNG